MQVAAEMFYQQGYRATGINELIEQSGVAKATFYKYFPAKGDLELAYIKAVVDYEIHIVESAVAAVSQPREKILAVIESLRPWLQQTRYRGCAFLHTVAEFPDHRSPMRKQGKRYYDYLRKRVVELCMALKQAQPKKYRQLQAQSFAEEFMLLFIGAIAMAQLYHADWPVDHALTSLRRRLPE